MILAAPNDPRPRVPCCAGCRSQLQTTSPGLGDAAAGGAAVPLADGLAQLIRALPACADGRRLVQFMNSALTLSYRGGLIAAASPARERQALLDAMNAPRSIGIEIPWFPWSTAPTYCVGSGPRDKAIGLATRAIAAASAAVGVTAVKVEAVKELVDDLTKPPFGATDWGAFAKKIGIGIAVAGGVYVGGRYVVAPALRRVAR